MPLGKYYCDYCDKQFQDTAAARRRHLQGSQHHRARALWYDTVRRQESQGGAFPLLQHEDPILGQSVCNHFLRTACSVSFLIIMLQGTCKFGDGCRYFHPKPHAVSPAALAPSGPIPGAMVQQTNFLGTQPNFVGYQAVEGNSFSGNLLGRHNSWGNLPPSLQPPPDGGYPSLPFVDWG
nr:zinc finger CCCH domain-containing protein 3 isoform X1 [Lolium perenne]